MVLICFRWGGLQVGDGAVLLLVWVSLFYDLYGERKQGPRQVCWERRDWFFEGHFARIIGYRSSAVRD